MFQRFGEIVMSFVALILALYIALYIGSCVRYWFKNRAVWKPTTEKRLMDRQAQEPDDPKHALNLSDLYLWRMYRSTGDNWNEQASSALEWYERAYQLTKDADRKLGMLRKLAKRSYDAYADDKAGKYATTLLTSVKKQPNFGKGAAIHDGNMVLGLVAAKRGDVARAREFLLKSGRTPGGPGLNSGGPNMLLAQKLLELGEREVVLEYFALCAKFWKIPLGSLKRWERQVRNGQTPNFGKQLIR